MLKLLPACGLLLAGLAPATAQMLTAPVEGSLNRTVRTTFRPADAAAHRVLEGRDPRSRWVVMHWTVQPGQTYTLDYRYPRLGASYCVMGVDGDPFRVPYQGAFLGSTCGGWFTEGRAPAKAKHVAKYLVRIAPDSPGTDFYVIFTYYPRADEPLGEPEAEITLRSPADPGVDQEAPMPGWESQGPSRYYEEWSRAPAAAQPLHARAAASRRAADHRRHRRGDQPEVRAPRKELRREIPRARNAPARRPLPGVPLESAAGAGLHAGFPAPEARRQLLRVDARRQPAGRQGNLSGGSCWGWFMEGRAPEKPKSVTKYRVRIAPDSPGRELYVVFAYRPRAEEKVAEPEVEMTLRSPADAGVEQEAPMPGWEFQGPARFYSDWSREPLRLAP